MMTGDRTGTPASSLDGSCRSDRGGGRPTVTTVAGIGLALALGAIFVVPIVLGSVGVLEVGRAERLLRVAGVTLLTTMPLAAMYASSVFSGSTVLDIPTMARVHGTLNALGFALPAVVAMNLEARRTAAFRGRTAAARQERAVAAMGGHR